MVPPPLRHILTDYRNIVNKKLRRSTREKNLVRHYGYDKYMAYHYAFMMKVASVREPETLSEAIKDLRWVDAMNEEMQALCKNETWDLVPHTRTRKRLVVDGFTK